MPKLIVSQPDNEGSKSREDGLKKMRVIPFISIFILMFAICSSPTLKAAGLSSNGPRIKTTKGFAIYLLAGDVKSRQRSEPDIDHLRIESKPIISMDDIVGYSRLMHEIELTNAAWLRIINREVSGSGRSFVVYVDDKPIYVGAFWTPEPPLKRYVRPVIATTDVTAGHPVIRLQLSYLVTSKTSLKEDKRSDPRILRVFEQTGRLREVLSSGGVRALRTNEQQLVLEEKPSLTTAGPSRFSLLLRPDGTATYFGFREVEKIEEYSGTYSKEEYSRLSALLLTEGPYEYDDSGAMSQPRIYGIVHKGELKMIADNVDHRPGNSFAVAKTFDDIAARIKWTSAPVLNSSGIRGTANLEAFSELREELSFLLQVTLAGGENAIKSQTLTGKGEFQFNLPPGIYRVRGWSGWRRRGAPPRSKTQFVIVEAGKFTQVAIDYRG